MYSCRNVGGEFHKTLWGLVHRSGLIFRLVDKKRMTKFRVEFPVEDKKLEKTIFASLLFVPFGY